MSMDPRRLFDWYPIQRLDAVRPRAELHELRGMVMPAMLRTQTDWVAIVRRIVGRDMETGFPIWSEPEEVDLRGVQHEMEEAHAGLGPGVMFRIVYTDTDPTERVRDEINLAAAAVAARTEEPAGYGRPL